MSQPGDTIQKYFYVIDQTTRAVVNSLDETDFTIVARKTVYGGSDSAHSPSATVTEIGSTGLYVAEFALPASGAHWFIHFVPSNASYSVAPALDRGVGWAGETENQDWDSLFNTVAQPSATLSSTVQLGSRITLELVARRYREATIPVLDSAGASLDLATLSLNNLRIAMRSRNGSVFWQAAHGEITGLSITVNGSGQLAIVFPEDLVAPASTWAAATSYALGTVRGPTTPDGTAWIVTTAGTSHASTEPTWTGNDEGDTVTDNDVVWTRMHDPYAQVDTAVAAGNDETTLLWEVTGDQDGSTSKTIPIIRSSTCSITRDEVTVGV